MHTLLKTLILSSTPALLTAHALADTPTTQPAATQPALATTRDVIPFNAFPKWPPTGIIIPSLDPREMFMGGEMVMGPNGPYRVISVAGIRR